MGEHRLGHLVDQARRTEALAFDSVWAADIPITRPRADPLLLLAAATYAANWLCGYVAAGARHLVIRLATDDHDSGLEEFAARVLPLLHKEKAA